jgi:Cu/Ag efflux protein CusF
MRMSLFNLSLLGLLATATLGGPPMGAEPREGLVPRTHNGRVALVNAAPAVGLLAGFLLPAAAMAQNIVEGKGKVVAVSREKQQVVLEHGEIKGFMDPMTMGYKVDSRSLLNEVRPGDQVRFSIDTQKSTIVTIVKEPK